MSLFYSSNERKESKYVKENKIRELNQEAQQQIVDEQIDKELGLDRKATNIGLLSKRVADKLVNATARNGKVISANDTLLNAINNGKLSELFNKIKALPDSLLSKTQRLIRDDLKNEETKKIVNELIAESVPNGSEAIKIAVLQSLGGINNEDIVLDMISKINEKVNLTETKSKVPKNTKISVDNVLDTVGFTNKIKPRLNSNLDILDNAVKFNKLSELFKELKSIPEDYLNDTQKNIKLKLSNPQAKEIINDLISNAVEQGNVKEINKIVLNELISVGNKKESKDLNEMLNMTSIATPSEAATSFMSDAPQKIDGRMFNKGKKKDTNIELNEFSDLLIKYENAPRGKKGTFNQKLKNIIARQRLINPKIADRMLQMKNAITNMN